MAVINPKEITTESGWELIKIYGIMKLSKKNRQQLQNDLKDREKQFAKDFIAYQKVAKVGGLSSPRG